MKTINPTLLLFSVMTFLLLPHQGQADSTRRPTVSGTEAFECLKRLAGQWQGTAAEPGALPSVTVIYRVTSANSVVLESLFPDTDHEMLTVYHLDKGKLVMTHYCAMGNQPHMKLASSSTVSDLHFQFAGGSNLNPSKDAHMHSAHIHLRDADHITGEWQGYKDGRPSDAVKFDLVRSKQPASGSSN